MGRLIPQTSSVLRYLPKAPVEAYNLSSAPVQPFDSRPAPGRSTIDIYIVIPIHFLSGRCALRSLVGIGDRPYAGRALA